MTCNFTLVGGATLYILQNTTFGFEYDQATEYFKINRDLWILRRPFPRAWARWEAQRSAMDSRTPLTPFILTEPAPRLPKAAAARLMEEGAGEPEVLRGATLLRPFYRPGAGSAGGPRGGRAAGRAGQRRSRSGGAALLPSPFRATGAACGGVPARPGCSRSGVPAAGALREERASCRRFLLRGGRKAARPGSGRGPGLGGSAAVAGQPPSLPQWGRAGRGKGRAPPPRWAMEWGSAARQREDGRWRRRRRLQRQLVSGRCVQGCEQGNVAREPRLPSGEQQRGTAQTGEWGRRACEFIWGGGWGLWVPFGCDDNERWLRGGGRVAAVVRSGEKRPAFEGGFSEGDLVHFSFFLLSFFDCSETLGVRCCFPLSGQRREQPGWCSGRTEPWRGGRRGWGRRAGLALGERGGRGCAALPSLRSQAPA